MKEMCLPCYGTGQIRCQVCGGTGVMPNISVLGEDCRKCKGSRKGRCQLCRGSGFTVGDLVPSQYPTEEMIDMTLADSFPASDPPSWTLGLGNQSGMSAGINPVVGGRVTKRSTETAGELNDRQHLLVF
jgi:hypothetical protein